jgi:hypothetical protein
LACDNQALDATKAGRLFYKVGSSSGAAKLSRCAARKFKALQWGRVRIFLPLCDFAEYANVAAGGSPWGSKGNAVRVLVMLTKPRLPPQL